LGAPEVPAMEFGPWEKRIMGILLLLTGLTLLALGIHTGQVQVVFKMIIEGLKSALSGL